jgi:hypothetical protein
MTFWLMIEMMIHNLISKSFNIFNSHELNDFLKICHALMTLISFFRRFRSLHFNRFRMIATVLRLSILNFRLSLMLMIRRERWNLFDRNFDDQNCWAWELVDFDVMSKIHENQLISHLDLSCLIFERIFQSRYFE